MSEDRAAGAWISGGEETRLPDVQLALRPGVVDLAWGHPDPELLPVDQIAQAAGHALAQDGWASLAYGAEQGPGRLIDALRAWLREREGLAPPPEQVLITGGISQALDMLCTLLTRTGDVILVQAPVYHLALRIFRDHGLVLLPVPSDDDGLQVDALAETLERLAREGRPPRFLYCVPTFCNPTGVSLSESRRAALAAVAEETGLLMLEDDAYRELAYDGPAPHPLAQIAPGRAVRLGSFSKVLAPGLRLGWLLAPPAIVRTCIRGGMLDSGGGVNHFTAHVAAAYLELGLLGPQIERLRRVYRRRRDVLVDALAKALPPGCRFVPPQGGFFTWVELPFGYDAGKLSVKAPAHGISYVPGLRFYPQGGGEHSMRLAFCLFSEQELREGATRLGVLLRTGAREL